MTSSPGPSVAMTTTPSHASASPFLEEEDSGETVIENTYRETPVTSPKPHQGGEEPCSVRAEAALMPGTGMGINNNVSSSQPTSANPTGKMKYWQQVKSEMPKEILNFSEDIIFNIITYDQLHDFAIKCDISTNWVEGAKEDNPHDYEMMVTKVFFEWWGRSYLNIGKKIQLVQIAFEYMGKPAVFHRIICKYPNLKILLEYARSNDTLALTGGDGVI